MFTIKYHRHEILYLKKYTKKAFERTFDLFLVSILIYKTLRQNAETHKVKKQIFYEIKFYSTKTIPPAYKSWIVK